MRPCRSLQSPPPGLEPHGRFAYRSEYLKLRTYDSGLPPYEGDTVVVAKCEQRPNRLSLWVAILTALMAVISLATVITTPPRSGSYCPKRLRQLSLHRRRGKQ